MKNIIEIHNISKRYRIGANKLPMYSNTFRDLIVNKSKSLFNKSDSDKNYFWALNDISFDVKESDVIGIIGRNGAGKSTLLKILSRITQPTKGNILLNGRTASLLEVGTGFHTELTGRENIYLNGAILGMKKYEIEKKFDEIVAFSEVERFIDTPVKRYSSGMYMRLAFSVAAHLNPEILIVDEVLAVGDFEFQKKCLGKMSGISKSGTTVLFVSHSMSAVKQLCSKAILLDEGKLIDNSEVEAVINKYLDNNNDELIGERDLSDFPRMGCELSDFRLTKIKFAEGKVNYNLWDDIKLDIEFILPGKPRIISFGFTVFTFDEYPAFTVDTQDSGFNINAEPDIKSTIRSDITHPNLSPGKYFVRAYARSGNSIIDLVDRVLFFEVGPGLNTFPVKTAWHGMRAESSWQVIK